MKSNYSLIRIFSLILLITSANRFLCQTNPPIVRLSINESGFNDETVFYFQQGGTPSFQSDFDAYKLIPNQGMYPYIGSLSSDSILTSISGLPALPVNLSIPVKAISPVTKSFTFSAEQSDFPNNVCVTLYDRFTGISTRILSSDYVCTLYDTTTVARFRINFSAGSFNASSEVRQASCSSPDAGMIIVKAEGGGAWNYEWTSGNTIIKTSLNKSTPDSMIHLSGGNFSVKITDNYGCASLSKTFTLNNIVASKASFISDVSKTSLSNSSEVHFSNMSTGSQINSWDFGDNSGTWFIPSPSYNYQAAGVYTVTLISESITHCKDTAQQIITVINDVTGIASLSKAGIVRLATLSQGNYELLFALEDAANVELELIDLKGTLIKSERLENITTINYPVDLSSSSEGMYLLKVGSQGSQKIFKLLR